MSKKHTEALVANVAVVAIMALMATVISAMVFGRVLTVNAETQRIAITTTP